MDGVGRDGGVWGPGGNSYKAGDCHGIWEPLKGMGGVVLEDSDW